MRRKSLVVLMGLISAAGCQRMDSQQHQPVFSSSPLVIDQAIQHRDWDRSVVEYANGAVVAGPTLFPYQPRTAHGEWQQAAVAPLLFVGQTFALPVMLFITPPTTEVAHEGVAFDPTYTAVPPLPASTPEVYRAIEAGQRAPDVAPPPPGPTRPLQSRDQATPPNAPEPAVAPAPAPQAPADAIDRSVQKLTAPAAPAGPATRPTGQPDLNK